MKRIYAKSIKARLRKGEKLTIGMIPCKANIESNWISPCWVTVSSAFEFDAKVAEYTYYNCNNQLGNYPHYYIESEVK